MSLPCRAVHDIGLYPDVAAGFRPAHLRELPIGWTEGESQSVLDGRVGAEQGLVTVRTLDLDRDNKGVKSVYDFLAANVDEVHPDLEVPLEDAALAFDAEGGFPVPAFPVYGYTGIRRAVNDDTAAAEPFDHRLAPVTLPLRDWLFVHVHRCLVGLTHELILNFDLAVTRTAESDDVRAVTVSLTQDRVVLLGFAPAEPQSLFRLGDAQMSFLAGRVGVHVTKLVDPESEPRWKFWKWLDVLVDLGLVSAGSRRTSKIAFRTRSGGNLDLVLRDVGWKDGKPSVTAWIPDGIELQVLGARGFHIDEVGLATTTHGASYLKLSASYQVGGSARAVGPARLAAAPTGQRHLASRSADPGPGPGRRRPAASSRSTASSSRSTPPTARTSRAAAGCATRSSTATACASSDSGSGSSSRPARRSSSSAARFVKGSIERPTARPTTCSPA